MSYLSGIENKPDPGSKMKSPWTRNGIRAVCIAGATAFTGITTATAGEVIGTVAVVRGDVNQALSSGLARISVGDNVTSGEVVQTGTASAAKIVFSDNTNMAIGPGSKITLGKFVYSGENSFKKATLQLAKGAFRFTSGSSDKRAYEIKTPTATIGLRGTVLDIRVGVSRSGHRRIRHKA